MRGQRLDDDGRNESYETVWFLQTRNETFNEDVATYM